jgi:hypothetical protein
MPGGSELFTCVAEGGDFQGLRGGSGNRPSGVFPLQRDVREAPSGLFVFCSSLLSTQN